MLYRAIENLNLPQVKLETYLYIQRKENGTIFFYNKTKFCHFYNKYPKQMLLLN